MIRHYLFGSDGIRIGDYANKQSFETIPLEETEVKKFIKPKWDGEKVVEGLTNEDKLKELRRIRNELLISTLWIMQRHQGESEGKRKGITTKNTTITELEYEQWLLYWEALRDLPATANLTNVSINNIMSVFPQMPEIK